MDSVRDLPAALVEAGAIRAAASIMARFIDDSLVQLTGIEAMSSLVGNRWAGLRAFADVGGMERVEEAMRRHGQDSLIQTKGVRALGSGVQWPQDIQERARYSHRRAVELTKTARISDASCICSKFKSQSTEVGVSCIMSDAPVVPVYVKALAYLGRLARHCSAEPWPAPKRDTRTAAFAGKQDDGTKALVDKEGPKGGGQRAILVSRPEGDIKESDFQIVVEKCPEPGPGEVLVKAIYISLDPTHRLWASEQPQYMPCVGLNHCMRAGVIGKVVKSYSGKWKEGTYVGGLGGVQEYFLAFEEAIYPVIPGVPLPLNHSLLNVGIGLTAWVGVNICEPKPGQTLVVSGAAGAVGSVAAQLAKARGMKVVGLAGSDAKCAWLKDEVKLHGVINYKTEDLEAGLARCCPDGVDAYFDNVGGKTLETMLTKMNRFGRIAYCGHISGYNSESAAVQVNQFQMILMRRLKIQGFICMDHFGDMMKSTAELLDLYVQGKMKVQEDIQEVPVAKYVQCVNMLYSGKNNGKLMMKVSDE
eukprot:Skav223234  [mRNA]  locus=scaffold2231:307719:311862:- [translate_table: standard]